MSKRKAFGCVIEHDVRKDVAMIYREGTERPPFVTSESWVTHLDGTACAVQFSKANDLCLDVKGGIVATIVTTLPADLAAASVYWCFHLRHEWVMREILKDMAQRAFVAASLLNRHDATIGEADRLLSCRFFVVDRGSRHVIAEVRYDCSKTTARGATLDAASVVGASYNSLSMYSGTTMEVKVVPAATVGPRSSIDVSDMDADVLSENVSMFGKEALFHVVFSQSSDDGQFVGLCPSLGISTQPGSPQEALHGIRKAVLEHVWQTSVKGAGKSLRSASVTTSEAARLGGEVVRTVIPYE